MRKLRRHHRARLREKRKAIPWALNNRKCLSSLVDTPTPCSCPICGNPRKYNNEITRQEQKNMIDFMEWYKLNKDELIEEIKREYNEHI